MKYLKNLIKTSILLATIFQGVLVGQDSLDIKGIKIPLIYEKNSNLPIVSMQLVFKASGAIKDADKPGLARFSTMILNEGTKSLGAVGFATRLEQKAISFTVHSGVETLVFEINSLKENFDFALKELKELLSEPNLTKESIEKVRLLSLATLSRKESDFDYLASKELKRLFFEGTPLENSSFGTVQSVQKISLEDVKDFIKEHLTLANAVVVLGGDIVKEEIEQELMKALSSLPHGEKREISHILPNEKMQEIEIIKPSEQAYVYFGSPFNLDSTSKEQYKAKVASFILGASGFGSRLMEEIRVKRGLAYSAYGRVSIDKSSSKFSGHLQTKNSNKDEAVKLVKEVVSSFVENGVTSEELEQAKRFLLGSEPLRNETLSQRLSRDFREYYLDLEKGYFQKELELINDLTLEELNDFIKKHPEISSLTFAIVTNKDEDR